MMSEYEMQRHNTAQLENFARFSPLFFNIGGPPWSQIYTSVSTRSVSASKTAWFNISYQALVRRMPCEVESTVYCGVQYLQKEKRTADKESK